jgi:predicted dehydrogenase (TIGR03970 family)
LHSDVLIIGAGSAGSVLAERLSADDRCQVAVLESGPGLSEPAVAALTTNGSVLPIGAASPVVRRYQTTLTEHPARAAPVVRGVVVGGSGAVNGGYFCRGLPRDFDGWGIPGWRWRDVEPHFRAIENDLDFDSPIHGNSGPIPVHRTAEFSRTTDEFVRSARDAGYPWIADLNAGTPGEDAGVGAVPLNIADGVRANPGAAFLQRAVSRPNLTLLTHTTARRVRVASDRAVGVDAIGPDGSLSLSAERIILSAGAIETAHLLMLSGIGEETGLRRTGIRVVARLPVGARCIDHPEWVMPAGWATAPGRPVLEAILVTADGIELRPYTGGFVAMVGDGTAGRPDWPHIGVALMRPASRGRLTLVSPDPGVPVRIEHRYDSEPGDVVALRRGSGIASELCRPLTQLGKPLWSTSQHLCGSAPIGNDDDENAVLDPRCGVRGVDGLWVVDGSALPAITSRGPHATIVMLAHRAAEFVMAG